MPINMFKSSFTLTFLLSFTLAAPGEPKIPNANHVFNAVHSSMRQWGSSLNHNGMSFFLATVPAGTQLYHGTSKSDAITGMQWLAFEPEHALIFARPRGGPPPGNGRGPPPDEIEDQENDVNQDWTSSHRRPDEAGHGSRSGPDRGNKPRPPPKRHDGSRPPGRDSPPHYPHEGPPKGGRPPPPPGHHGNAPPPPPEGHNELAPPGPPPHHPHDVPPKVGRPLPGLPHPHGGPRKNERLPPGHQEYLPLPRKHDREHGSQRPMNLQEQKPTSTTGYLHTYTPVHSLRLLYIDGLSAGKTSNGTLDTQDMLLLNLTETDGPMGGENERAIGMCNLASTLWKGKIDGILRMEGGFEIILCNFEQHLERTGVVAVKGRDGPGHPGGPGNWQYIRAIASRYHSIGGERVTIDYEDFVSVFAYSDLDDLFVNDVQSDYAMPRLQNVKEADRLHIKDEVTDMILRKDWDGESKSRNWQAVADMVVQRFSEPLHYLRTDETIREDKAALAEYLTMLLRPFIDESDRNATLETQRCVSQLVSELPTPPLPAVSLAHRTLHAVTHQICNTLLTSLSIASSSTPHSSSATSTYVSHAVEIVDELFEYLQWTIWKDCGTCGDNEICFIPVWPTGSHEDHAHPKCKNEQAASGSSGYWGSHRGGPPGRGGPSGHRGPPGRAGPPAKKE